MTFRGRTHVEAQRKAERFWIRAEFGGFVEVREEGGAAPDWMEETMTGQRIVAEAARRAVKPCSDTCAACRSTIARTTRGFAPFAELIEAARHMRLIASPHLVGKEPCDRLDKALAEVEKMGGE